MTSRLLPASARAVLAVLTAVLLVAIAPPLALAADPQTTRASLGAGDAQADSASEPLDVTADGRFVVFDTRAALVAADDNGTLDVYLRDTEQGTTELVSRAAGADGIVAALGSGGGAVSEDGRYVAFHAYGPLTLDDLNGATDVYVRDTVTKTTTLVSRAGGPFGAEGDGASNSPSISADGHRVAFISSATNFFASDTNDSDVFVRDLDTNTLTLASRADGRDGAQLVSNSAGASLSADGLHVAFATTANGFTADDTNTGEYGYAYGDVFVRDLADGRTERVSVANSGAQGNATSGQDDYYSGFAATAISAHGERVAFFSAASNLVGGDTNGRGDVFVRDREAGATELVTRASGSDGAIAAGGRTQAQALDLSHDGRYVAFASAASNLAPDDGDGAFDVFLRDTSGKLTLLVSRASGRAGTPAAQPSDGPVISSDGQYVAFRSDDSYLVSGDSNGAADTFLRGPLPVPVITGDATANTTSATVGAFADASLVPLHSDGSHTTLAIEYGEDRGADTDYSRSAEVDASGPPVAARIAIADLAPSRTYRYRAVATNTDGGRAAGIERTFATDAATAQPSPPSPTPEPTPPTPQPQPPVSSVTIVVGTASQSVAPGTAMPYSYALTYTPSGDHYTVQVTELVDADTDSWAPRTQLATTKLNGGPGSVTGSGTYTPDHAGIYKVVVRYYAHPEGPADKQAEAVFTARTRPDPGTLSDPECKAPTVSSVSTAVAAGDRVEVAGSGLGRSGEVRVAGIVAPTPEWTPQRVVVVVPDTVKPGAASVTLRCGAEADYRIVTTAVTVQRRVNLAPTANVIVTGSAHDHSRFRLDGRSSVDPEGKALAYEWRRLTRAGKAGRVLSRRPELAVRARAHTRVQLTVRDPEGAAGRQVVALDPGQRSQTTRLMLPAALFAFDRAALRPQDERALGRVRRLVRGAELLRLTGRTDRIGSRAYNRQLSARRAQAVKRYLLAGVTGPQRPHDVVVRAWGEDHPLPHVSQRTARGRALNRSVEVLIVRRTR